MGKSTIVEALAQRGFRVFRGARFPALVQALMSPPASVLDVGCGAERWFSTRLARRGYEVTAADITDGVVLPHLPYSDGAFDIVVCLEVLEHTNDPVRSLQELCRVTRHQLLVTVPHEPWFTLWRLGWWEPGHLWALTPTGCQRLLGPAKVNSIGFGRYWQLMWDKSQMLGSRSNQP